MLKTSTFRLQIVCPGCNSYHALSGFTDFDTCQNCGKSINVGGVLNEKLFSFMDKVQYMNGFLSGTIEQMGAGAYKLEYSSTPPVCEECQMVLDADILLKAIDEKIPLTCSSCSHKMPVRAADAVIKEFHPKAIGVINDSYGADSGQRNTDKDTVLVFKCMTCGAGLELTSDTGRTMKCGYCDNENYLPDSIWTKLHPNKEVQPLYLLLDLNAADIQGSVDYFLRITALKIYEKHFTNFIREYFGRPFISDSFVEWIKALLTAKNNEQVSFNMDITRIQKFFYENLNLGTNSLPGKLLEAAGEYGKDIPVDLQIKLAGNKNEAVRVALAKNTDLNKDVLKQLKEDSSLAVGNEAKKHKTGFFKSLFN